MTISALDEVMEIRGRGVPHAGQLTIANQDPVLPTAFRVGETCAAVLAGVGTALSDIWELRTGRRQQVKIDVRHAAAGLNSAHYLQRPNRHGIFEPVHSEAHELRLQCSQPFATRDNRWFLPHFGLPNLAQRALDILDCDFDPASIATAISSREALELEDKFDEARACGAMVRSCSEWLSHPHGQILSEKPIIEISRIGDSPPEPFSASPRPLTGLRVLDLTRILAGPMAARTLAEHGADVLMVTGAELPQIPEHVLDTSHGKRSCFIDLKTVEGVVQLQDLVRGADVFSQGYRPGVLERLGFGPEALAALRPGIVALTISCFGSAGPFSHRAGWEQIAQTVTGICHDGAPDRPALLPAAACDYITGYLGAYGTLLALARRAREGGSYHVRVSLCQSGMFLYRQGKVPYDGGKVGLDEAEIDSLRIETRPRSGPLRHLGPILALSETPGRWDRPTPELGGDKPRWLAAAAAAAAE